MTPTALDLDSIESAAREATPGPWRWDPHDCSFHALHDEGSHASTVAFADSDGVINISDADARHIASASPDVVLAMVARIRELEGAVDTAIELLDEAGIDNERSQSLTSIRWPAKPEVAKVFRSLLPSDAGKERTSSPVTERRTFKDEETGSTITVAMHQDGGFTVVGEDIKIDARRSNGYLPGRLRIAAGTVNFNESRVLRDCLNDAADEIERLLAKERTDG